MAHKLWDNLFARPLLATQDSTTVLFMKSIRRVIRWIIRHNDDITIWINCYLVVTLCFYVVGKDDIFISLLQSEDQYKLQFLPFMIFERKMNRLLFFLGET